MLISSEFAILAIHQVTSMEAFSSYSKFLYSCEYSVSYKFKSSQDCVLIFLSHISMSHIINGRMTLILFFLCTEFYYFLPSKFLFQLINWCTALLLFLRRFSVSSIETSCTVFLHSPTHKHMFCSQLSACSRLCFPRVFDLLHDF